MTQSVWHRNCIVVLLLVFQQVLAELDCDALTKTDEAWEEDALLLLQRNAGQKPVGQHGQHASDSMHQEHSGNMGHAARQSTPPTHTPSTENSTYPTRTAAYESYDGSQDAKKQASCAPLTNQQSYFTVPVTLGTPEQVLDVVVDTGSTLLVAESCSCKEHGSCDKKGHCFNTKSSTFMEEKGPHSYIMSYGSGDIKVDMVTDIVKLGDVSATMDNALMLMTESKMNIPPPEGILGLGVPMKGDITSGFLEISKVNKFSVCFSATGVGALRLNKDWVEQPLGQLGETHWLLDFRGASVGSDVHTAKSLGICDPDDMQPGQQMPCAIIPDTGTTNIILPVEHYVNLLASMCSKWKRCNTAVSEDAEDQEKAELFEALLHRCGDWMTEGDIDEVPSLHMKMRGKEGNVQVVTLRSWSFVVKTMMRVTEDSETDTGYGTIDTPKEETVVGKCVPAFTAADYSTQATGPLWVVGLPLFYEYTVLFDLGTKPATVGFSQEPCDSCDAESSLYGGDVERAFRAQTKGRALRQQDTSPRIPHIDLTKPL